MEVLSVSWLAHVLQCYPKYCERILHKLARGPHWHHDCSQALYLYHQKCKSINLPVPKRGARILRDTLVGCNRLKIKISLLGGSYCSGKTKLRLKEVDVNLQNVRVLLWLLCKLITDLNIASPIFIGVPGLTVCLRLQSRSWGPKPKPKPCPMTGGQEKVKNRWNCSSDQRN